MLPRWFICKEILCFIFMADIKEVFLNKFQIKLKKLDVFIDVKFNESF